MAIKKEASENKQIAKKRKTPKELKWNLKNYEKNSFQITLAFLCYFIFGHLGPLKVTRSNTPFNERVC